MASGLGLLWFCFTLFCDQSRKLAPISKPIKCETKTTPTWSLTSPHASSWVLVFILSSYTLMMMLTFVLICSCYYFQLVLIVRHLIDRWSILVIIAGVLNFKMATSYFFSDTKEEINMIKTIQFQSVLYKRCLIYQVWSYSSQNKLKDIRFLLIQLTLHIPRSDYQFSPLATTHLLVKLIM